MINYKEQAEMIKGEYRANLISYEEAKHRLKPFIDEYNKKSKEIAKKYNQKPRTITAQSFLR